GVGGGGGGGGEGKGKGGAAGDPAVMSGGLAVELVHLAGAVLDVPARDGCGEHFDENVGWPDVRDRIVAADKFFRPAKPEQTDRFHRVHQSPKLARLPSQRMNRLKSAFLARSPICLST